MIDLPSLPTDSLYKFLALSGLMVIFASGFLYAKLRRELNDKIYKVECSHAKGEARLNFLEAQECPDQEQVCELRVLTSVTQLGTKEARRLLTEFQVLRQVFFSSIVVGLVMAGGGFYLWYQKVQAHQDLFLQLQVEEMRQSANQAVNRTP